MRSHGDPKAEKLKLVHLPERYKPEEPATSRMHWNLQVASFNSRDTIQSPLRTERTTDWRISILKEVFRTFRFSNERSITGLHDPKAFITTNSRL